MASTCSVRFEHRDGKSIEVIVTNTNTMKEDRFVLDVDEQGSTYHLLLSQVTKERLVGRASVRELIDNIGAE